MSKFINQANKRALEYFRSGTDGKGLDHNALAFAIKALEKQVPKRAVDAHAGTICPACRANLFLEDLNAVEKSRYCPDCGQRFEWH